MAEIHVLNVGKGDCTIFKSNKGRVTMFDICGGNLEDKTRALNYLIESSSVKGNFQMCKHPTNSIYFLKNSMDESFMLKMKSLQVNMWVTFIVRINLETRS